LDLTPLANRLAVRSSIARAVDALDAFSLRVLEVVTLLGGDAAEAAVTELVGVDAATCGGREASAAGARPGVAERGAADPVRPLRDVLGITSPDSASPGRALVLGAAAERPGHVGHVGDRSGPSA
jgi:hypothetical protein